MLIERAGRNGHDRDGLGPGLGADEYRGDRDLRWVAGGGGADAGSASQAGDPDTVAAQDAAADAGGQTERLAVEQTTTLDQIAPKARQPPPALPDGRTKQARCEPASNAA